MVTGRKTSSGTEGAQPTVTTSKLDPLDQELGKDSMKDVLGNYFDDKTQSAVTALIHANLGLTRSEPMEAMDIDTRHPPECVVDMQDQPMETEQSEPSLGTFQPELRMASHLVTPRP